MSPGEAVDERAEADALDDAADPEPAALLIARTSPTVRRVPGRIRVRTDVGSRRGCEGQRGVDALPDVETSVIEPEALEDLVEALPARGFRVVGPTVRDGAIVYDELESAADLPIGWTDVQEAGSYRLERRDDEARFGYAVGPHSWKQFLLPPRVRLWRARRRDDGFEVEEEPPEDAPLAFIGVRACELHAIAIQDRVFLGGRYADRDYAARREDAFVVAVNCFEPGGTCFCVSMGTGPKAEAGYDLALTEILDGAHRLLVEVGSERGAEVLGELPRRARRAGRPRRGRRRGRRGRRAHGPPARHDRHPRPARAQPRAPALGRRRHALPHLRQLHDGLPDLLLHDRRGRHRPDRASTPSGRGPGTRASRSTTPTSTAAASARPAARATASG